MCVPHRVPDTSREGHDAMKQHVVMVVHVVMLMRSVVLMRTVLSAMMFLLVHMYVKLLYLWNILLYSEKLRLFTHWTKKCGILLF